MYVCTKLSSQPIAIKEVIKPELPHGKNGFCWEPVVAEFLIVCNKNKFSAI